MRVGIDISQLAYSNTGVATYLSNLVENLIQQDSQNEYVLFFSSLRKNFQFSLFLSTLSSRPKGNFQKKQSVEIRKFRIPPILLDIVWNKLHVLPVEWLIGPVDIFISSDWTQPPTKAKKMTILYDLIVYTYPQETARKIVDIQKKRMQWVTKEVDKILCISEATKKDAMEILKISKERLEVIYPGV